MFKQHVQPSSVLDSVFNSHLYLAGKVEFNRVITKMIITKYAGCHSNVTLSREGTGGPDHFRNDVTFQLRPKELGEGTWILFSHTRTKRGIELWSWKGIQGLVSLRF